MGHQLVKVLEATQYHNDTSFKFDGKLVHLIETLTSIYNSIPEGLRDEVDYEISAYENYGSAHATFGIDYYREETKDEKEDRERRWKQKEIDARNKRIADYAKLKAEFG